jgi:hypothetical protein
VDFLISKTPHLCQRTMSEWALALKHMGHKVSFWNKNEQPLFDVFYDNQPDVFITAVSDLTVGQIRCLKEFDETKLVAHEEYDKIKKIDLDRVDLFFNIYEKNFDFYAKSVYLPFATNWPILAERMQGVLSSPNYQCDISIICDYNEEIQKYVIPLLNTEYRLRIYGANWSLPQCVGHIPWEDRFLVYLDKIFLMYLPVESLIFFMGMFRKVALLHFMTKKAVVNELKNG